MSSGKMAGRSKKKTIRFRRPAMPDFPSLEKFYGQVYPSQLTAVLRAIQRARLGLSRRRPPKEFDVVLPPELGKAGNLSYECWRRRIERSVPLRELRAKRLAMDFSLVAQWAPKWRPTVEGAIGSARRNSRSFSGATEKPATALKRELGPRNPTPTWVGC